MPVFSAEIDPHAGFSDEEVRRLLVGRIRGARKDKSLYDRYIRRSIWWKWRRAEYLKSHPVCEGCRCRPARQVHHVNYRFFEEKDEDLQSLCGRCHKGFNRQPKEMPL